MLSFLRKLNHRPMNKNHPARGSSIKVEPIKNREAIEKIKGYLISRPRNYLLFVMGINTAFRANELLSLKVSQVRHLKPGDNFEIKLRKTQTYRRVTINDAVAKAIVMYLEDEKPSDDQWLFPSRFRQAPLSVSTVSNYVKRWCLSAGLSGNYASHTLRKTWGYWQRVANNTPIPLLMAAYGHSNQAQTLQYLCIQNEEIAGVYMSLVL